MIYPRGRMLYTDVSVDGRRRRISTGFTVGQEAQAMLVAARLQAGEPIKPKSGTNEPNPGLNLREGTRIAWQRWSRLKDQKMKLLHEKAAEAFFGADCKLVDIDAKLVQRWVNVLDAQGNSAATINRKLAWLSGLLRICHDLGHLERMPKIPRLREAPVARGYLSDAQVARLVEACEPEARPLLVFLRDTGCRISEALGLEWSHLGEASATFVDTKAGDVRTIPLTEAAQEAIETQRKALEGTPATGPFPMSYKAAAGAFKRAAEAADIDLPEGTAVHLMRHTTATALIERGASIRAVQQWLGHHSVTTTERYAKVTGNALAQVRDLLQKTPPKGA